MSPALLQRTRLLSIEDVERMLEVGILHEDEPFELIHGVLVAMPPQGPPHAGITSLVVAALQRVVPSGWHVREEKPLALDRLSAPEPDAAIVRGGPRDWLEAHPGPQDTALVVEVAWTSQEIDVEKAGIYARAGIPVYWLLDIPARTLTVYTDPDGMGRYRSKVELSQDQEVQVPLTEARWPVRHLLP